MKGYSTEQAANIAVVLGLILSYFKINIGNEEITQIFTAILVVGGIVYSWIKRYKRGDLKLSGFRK